MEDVMTTKNHNDPFGEELMALLNKYYYLDDSVEMFIMNIDTRHNEQTKWYAFKSVLFGESDTLWSFLLERYPTLPKFSSTSLAPSLPRKTQRGLSDA